VPSLTVTAVNNSTQIQITVFGADPNVAVMLYYPSSSSLASANLGQTSASGYLSVTVSPSQYPVAVGAPAYVLVDGSQSQIVQWPSASVSSNGSSGYITLSQNTVALQVGQGAAISVAGSISDIGTISVSSVSNPTVASVSVSGSQIVVRGLSVGATTVAVCATNAGCASFAVNVQQASSAAQTIVTQSSPTTISISQTTLALQTGRSQQISLAGPGSFYVSGNSNSGVALTSVTGSVLSVSGAAAGTAIINVCSAGNGLTSCGNVNVTVIQSTTTQSSSGSTSTVAFSQSSLNLTVGQKITVGLSSQGQSGIYYVSANSNPSAVTANINGNSVDVYGQAFGGSTVTICQLGGNCSDLYAYVVAGSGPQTAASVVASTIPPVLQSISISSNNVSSGFAAAGNALTVTFTLSQPVVTPVASIAGHVVTVNGSGSGPYTVIYTIGATDAVPVPISISFSNQSGLSGRAAFSIGLKTMAVPASSPVASANVSFSRYLDVGSTGTEVTALQDRLKADDFYSGPITGTFGALTEAAVKKYQAAHGLTQLGVVGPSTRTLLNQGK